jgi:CheY-like chemotaxis protein
VKKILVAEDKAGSRELIRTVLEDCGYEVVEARDGREAVDQAERSVPDLVLLDLHMPILDGYAALKHLRLDARFATIPFVALTANAMHGERERALAAGFNVYLTKPVDLVVLRTKLADLLDRRR